MQDRPMDSKLPTTAQRWLHCPKVPPAELIPALFVLDLLIILQVIANDKPRAFPPPLPAAHLLSATASEQPELMPVCHLNHNFSLAINHEPFDVELCDQFLILDQLPGDITQVLDREFFVRADNDPVVFDPE